MESFEIGPIVINIMFSLSKQATNNVDDRDSIPLTLNNECKHSLKIWDDGDIIIIIIEYNHTEFGQKLKQPENRSPDFFICNCKMSIRRSDNIYYGPSTSKLTH